MEDYNDLVKELEKISDQLYGPFPYKDIEKIYEDFSAEFSSLPDEYSLSADFNSYCANIAGVVYSILYGKRKKQNIPRHQISQLRLSFFELCPEYKFIEEHIKKYPKFYKQYTVHENCRKLLLKLLDDQNDQEEG